MASLLLALGNPTVNYLSLDLEGAELEVLSCSTLSHQLTQLTHTNYCTFRHNLNKFSFQVIKTIPFNQLNIEVLSVEFNLLGRLENWSTKKVKQMCCRVFPGSRALLHSHLHQAGYSYVGTLGGDKDEARPL